MARDSVALPLMPSPRLIEASAEELIEALRQRGRTCKRCVEFTAPYHCFHSETEGNDGVPSTTDPEGYCHRWESVK